MPTVGLVSHVDGYIIGTCTPTVVEGRSITIPMSPDNPYAVLQQPFMDSATIHPNERNRVRTFSASIKEWCYHATMTNDLHRIYHKGDLVPHVDETLHLVQSNTFELVRTYYAIELVSLQQTKYIAGFQLYENMDTHIREVYGVTARNARSNVDSLQEQLMLQKQQAYQLIQKALDGMRTDGAITEDLVAQIQEFSGRDDGGLQKFVTVPEPLAEAGHQPTRRIFLDDE